MAVSHTQEYDTLAPMVPTIDDITTGDNFINNTERGTGVTVTGEVESGVSVALCFNDGTGTIADCTGGVTATDTPEATTWSYDLTTANINTLGEGNHVARAVATDAAGNPGPAVSQPFTVDITAPAAPTFSLPAAGDIINIAERDTGVIIGGGVENGASVSVCLGAASLTDASCTGGTTVTTSDGVTGTTWRYTLSVAEVDAMGQGDAILLAYATDTARQHWHGRQQNHQRGHHRPGLQQRRQRRGCGRHDQQHGHRLRRQRHRQRRRSGRRHHLHPGRRQWRPVQHRRRHRRGDLSQPPDRPRQPQHRHHRHRHGRQHHRTGRDHCGA